MSNSYNNHFFYSGENKHIIDPSKYSYFASGGCSDLFKEDNTVLKVYNFTCNYRYHLSKKMFHIMKNLDIPNLVKLKDYFYDSDNNVHKLLPMDAYTMDYYPSKRIKLYKAEYSYLEEVFGRLEETINKLTDNGVMINDPSYSNIIFSEDGVLLFDLDQFEKSIIHSKKYIYLYNKRQLLEYVRKTLKEEKKGKYYDFIEDDNISFKDNILLKLKGSSFKEYQKQQK